MEMASYPAFADAKKGGGFVEGKKARNAGICLEAHCDARVAHSLFVCRWCDTTPANTAETDVVARWPKPTNQ